MDQQNDGRFYNIERWNVLKHEMPFCIKQKSQKRNWNKIRNLLMMNKQNLLYEAQVIIVTYKYMGSGRFPVLHVREIFCNTTF